MACFAFIHFMLGLCKMDVRHKPVLRRYLVLLLPDPGRGSVFRVYGCVRKNASVCRSVSAADELPKLLSRPVGLKVETVRKRDDPV